MPPSRFDIVVGLVLIVLCAVSAVGCALRGEWWWSVAGAGVMGFAVWELLGDLAERRCGRSRRPS